MNCGLELEPELIFCGAYKVKVITMKCRKGIVCLIGAGVLAVSALPQVARGVLSDYMIVRDAQGNQLAYLSVTEQDEINSPNNLWKMDTGIANAAQWANPTAVLEGPSEGVPGTISDIFGVARLANGQGGFNYYLAFMSDTEGVPLSIAAAETWFGGSYGGWATVTETLQNQGMFDATKYVDWNIYNNGVVGSATFFSDVPEPTTMIAGALLLLPFGASTLRILRKSRVA